jgi:hypothetical protein
MLFKANPSIAVRITAIKKNITASLFRINSFFEKPTITKINDKT